MKEETIIVMIVAFIVGTVVGVLIGFSITREVKIVEVEVEKEVPTKEITYETVYFSKDSDRCNEWGGILISNFWITERTLKCFKEYEEGNKKIIETLFEYKITSNPPPCPEGRDMNNAGDCL